VSAPDAPTAEPASKSGAPSDAAIEVSERASEAPLLSLLRTKTPVSVDTFPR
jgi:hypothetical protein